MHQRTGSPTDDDGCNDRPAGGDGNTRARLDPIVPNGARYWFTAWTCFGAYLVVLASKETYPGFEDKWGETDPDAHIIWIWEETPVECLPTVVIHELAHASVAGPGDDVVMSRLFGCSIEETPDREEANVAYFTTRLGDTMLRSGLIRLPPLPP